MSAGTNAGTNVRPLGWEARTSGAAEYAGDVVLPGTLHAAVLRSPHPHARIKGIDVERARSAPGVRAVVTSADLPDRRYHHLGEPFSDRAVLARGVVRFIGEEVAAVAADTVEEARAALSLITVTYEPLRAVTSPADALAPGAPRIHDHAPGNVSSEVTRDYGDMTSAQRHTAVRVAGRFAYARAAHASMEPHTVVASWDSARARLDLWPSSQAPYFVRHELAHVLDLDLDRVHTHEVAVGGSFGVKAKVCEHEAVAAALSMRAGRPVRLSYDRHDEFAATKTRHPYDIEIETGADDQGRLTYRDVRMVVDNGAYNHNGPSLPGYSAILTGSLYRLAAARASWRLAYTNNEPGGSFRGYGNPQITLAMESQVDEIADALGIDPIDLRIRNANLSGDTTLTGWRLESAGLVACLEAVREAIGWDEKRRDGGHGRGVGVAVAIHPSGANAYPNAEESGCAIDLASSGRVRVRFAGSDAGTGQRTVLAQLVADDLGIPVDDIEVVMMASEGTPRDLGAWSSRGTFMGGHAALAASAALKERLRELGAAKFGAAPGDVVIGDGLAAHGDDAVPVGDLVALDPDALDGELHVDGTYRTTADKMDRATGTGNFSESYSFVAQAVEVEVDAGTGAVRVLRVVTAHDSGTIVNPVAAEGQAIGSVAMGLGAALGEELLVEGGRIVNPRYSDYALLRSADMPPVEVRFVGGADPRGPRGAKGIGEIGLVPTPAAVANAIAHATGVRLRAIPFTPDRVLGALGEADRLPAMPLPAPLWRRPRRWWVGAIRAAYPRGLHGALHRWGTRLARPPDVPAIEEVARVATEAEAVASLQGDAIVIAGGTDLVPARRDGVRGGRRLVDVASVASMRQVVGAGDGSLVIGAAVTLAEAAAATAGGPFAVLAAAIEQIAGPQVRAAATVGGNLCQDKRCPFFRNGFLCYKRGGWSCPCYAVAGDHRSYHAVIDAHRCQAVTPSDLATVLAALDATVTVRGLEGERRLPLGELYRGPGEVDLRLGEVLTAVVVPSDAAGRVNRFEKLAAWSGGFALAAAATSVTVDRGTITAARVVLGGVAPTPYRARRVEDALVGRSTLGREELRQASAQWVRDAHPLPGNGWKLRAASTLVERCLVSSLQVPSAVGPRGR